MTESGTLPDPIWANALSGTMVSTAVLTAEPLDAVELPLLPIEFSAWLRAALDDDAAVELAAIGEVAQTPPDGEVVIAADAAAVGVDEVIGAKVDDGLDEDGPDDEDEDIAELVGSVAVGRLSDEAAVVLVVLPLVAAGVVVVEDAAVGVDAAVVDDDVVEDAPAAEDDDVVVVDEAVDAVWPADGAEAEAGEHAVRVFAALAEGPETVPALALVDCVPLGEPPAVLIKMLFRISGSCQYFGAASITT